MLYRALWVLWESRKVLYKTVCVFTSNNLKRSTRTQTWCISSTRVTQTFLFNYQDQMCRQREGSVTSKGGWSFRGSVWAVLSLSRPFRDRHIALLLSDMQCGTHLIYENLASSVEAAVSLKITPAPCCTRAWALCCKVSSSDASNSIPFALMPLKSLLSYWISKQDYWPPDDKRHTGGQRSGYGFMPPCYITAGEWLIVRYRSLAVCESVWMLLISIILKLKPLQSHDLLLLLPWWRGQPQCH